MEAFQIASLDLLTFSLISNIGNLSSSFVYQSSQRFVSFTDLPQTAFIDSLYPISLIYALIFISFLFIWGFTFIFADFFIWKLRSLI